MEISELRIGNYVLDNGLIHKIVSIRQKDYGKWVEDGQSNIIAMWDGAFYDCTEKEISPIILTEELLLKLGFSLIDHPLGKCYEMATPYEWFYIVDNGDFYTFAIENDYSPKCVITCKSLHQLQNRFYAITGQELEVNL